MAKDFKATQVRTSKLIASKSNSSHAMLMVYGTSSATDNAGSHAATMVSNVGSDVFLFVSGNMGVKGNRSNVALFGGDLVVSGTFFAEKMVAEVTSMTTSSHYVSGALFLERQFTDVRSAEVAVDLNQLAVYASKSAGHTRLYMRNSLGVKELIGKSDIQQSFFTELKRNHIQSTGSNVGIGSVAMTTASLAISGANASVQDITFFRSGESNYKKHSKFIAFKDAGGFANLDIAVSGARGKLKVVLNEKNDGTSAMKDMLELNVGGSGIKRSVMVMSGVSLASQADPATYKDTTFYVAGSPNSKDSTNVVGSPHFQLGVSLFAGDLVTSGAIHGGDRLQFGEFRTDHGTDVSTFISGAMSSKDSATKGVTVVGGDLVVSGGLDVDGTTFVVNETSNNVGIGTASPSVELEVSGTGGAGQTSAIQVSDRYPRILLDAGGVFINTKTFADQEVRKYGKTRVLRRYQSGGLGVIHGWGQNHAGSVSQTRIFDAGGHIQLIASASGDPSSPGYFKNVYPFLYHGSKVAGNRGSVMIMSGGAPASIDPANLTDTNFFVSGAVGSKGGSIKGTSVFGGDVAISGSLHGGHKAHSSAQYSAVQIGKFTSNLGKDVSLFVSGSKLSMDSGKTGTSAFGGDVVISGSLKVGTGSQGGIFVKHTNNRVGIGTNLPSASLNVVGDAHFVGDIYLTGTHTGTSQNRAIYFTAFDKESGGSTTDSGRIISLVDDPSDVNKTTLEIRQWNDARDRVRLIAGQIQLKATPSNLNTTGSIHATGSLRVTRTGTFNLGLSGSLTRLVDGKSYLVAGNNVTIASSSNGQVTISSTGGGGGSIDTVSGSTTVSSTTRIDFTKLALLTDLGSNRIALTGTIGDPEDGSYEDGLFTDFASNTPIGTAIDKINEVLSFLAPSPAPNLSRIGTSGSAAEDGVTALLSFGTSNDREGSSPQYFNVAASAGLGSAVNVNGTYQVATASNNIRMGVFGPTLSVIRGPLANNVAVNKYVNNVINHSGSVFGDGDKGTLSLNVNGSTLKSINLADVSVGVGDPGFGTQNQLTAGSGFINLSQTGSAVQSNGQTFGLFKNRSGDFQVDTAHQRSGWNYARVTHTVGTSTRTTNYIEWVNDNQGTAISVNNQRFTSTLSGSVYISGIQYATGAAGHYLVDVHNFYDFVYAQNTISFSTTNTSISSQTVPALDPSATDEHLSKIKVTGSYVVTEAKALDGTMAGGQVSSNLSVSHPIKANLTNTGSLTSGKFLIYKVDSKANNQFEDFVSESFRVISGSYPNQSSVTNSGNRWPGNQSLLLNNGLQFFAGKLKAPANTINGGDFRGADNGGSFFGTGLSKNGNPNYSGITGTRTFYRYFRNNSGAAIRDFDLFLTGVGATIVATGSALGTGNITVMAKGPGASGFVDLHAAFSYQTASDGAGGRLGALNASISGDSAVANQFTFGTASIGANEFVVLKIEAGHGWTGHLSGMNAIFPAVGASAVTPAPDVEELQIDSGVGATGKLSFGASKSIAGYINVTGSTASKGFGTNVDINGSITTSTNAAANKRYGLYGGSTTFTGDINGNANAVTGGSGTSHVADAFKDAHSGSLNLYVNDILKKSINLETISVGATNLSSLRNSNGTGFQNFTALAFGTDTNNLEDYRRSYRTGEFVVVPADQNNGWNWARVDHVFGGSTRQTTYVEWIRDADSGAISIPNVSSGSFGASGYYHQSGVKYFDTSLATVATGTISFKTQNAYNNVYSDSTTGLRLSALSNLTLVDIGITGSGVPTTTDSSPSSNGTSYPALRTDVSSPQNTDLHVTCSVKYTGGQSLPGDSAPISSLTSRNMTATFAARHPINSDATNNITVSNFLVYSGSGTGSNINTVEKFTGEFYRYASGSYDSQAETTGSWDSTISLVGADAYHNTGLLVYGNDGSNGFLISPKSSRLPRSGDFRTNGSLTSPDGNVNYAATSGTKDFYRAFLNNDSSDQANVVITIKGDANLVPRSGAGAGTLGASKNVFLDVKIPGKTGWMDAMKASDGSTNNGSGALAGDRDATVDSGGAVNTIDFQTAFIGGTGSGAEKFILRLVADAAWTGYITEISVSY